MVADDYPIKPWNHSASSFLMDRMWQICVARGGAFEEHHEAVIEALAEPFGAVIFAPCEVQDAGNLSRQILDDAPHFGDFLRGACGFELKEGDVFDLFHEGVGDGVRMG